MIVHGALYVTNGECGAVGRSDAAVDRHAHDGGTCSAHARCKADNVTHSPCTAICAVVAAVILVQANAVWWGRALAETQEPISNPLAQHSKAR